MESIGDKFKKRREEKGLFIEQIARDTNISKKFIEAIENENFSEMPGEAYLIGFFRTYADYLDIDPEEVISLYRNTKIQEQPVPEELILKKGGSFSSNVMIISGILLAAVAIGSGFYFLSGNGEKSVEMVEAGNNEEFSKQDADTGSDNPRNTANAYIMSDAFIERRFEEGDIIKIAVNSSVYNIVCKKIDSTVTLKLPSGEVELTAGNDYKFDLSGDNKIDIRIMLRDIDKKGRGAVLKFDKTTEAPAIASSEINSSEELSEVSRIAAEVTTSTGDSNLETRKQQNVTILKGDRVEPFTLNIVFRGYCLMRYLADDSQRDERYFHKGENFRIDVNSSVRLWLSNAGSALIDINGQEYVPGKSGEVSAKLIQWAKDKEGGNIIQSVPMY